MRNMDAKTLTALIEVSLREFPKAKGPVSDAGKLGAIRCLALFNREDGYFCAGVLGMSKHDLPLETPLS